MAAGSGENIPLFPLCHKRNEREESANASGGWNVLDGRRGLRRLAALNRREPMKQLQRLETPGGEGLLFEGLCSFAMSSEEEMRGLTPLLF